MISFVELFQPITGEDLRQLGERVSSFATSDNFRADLAAARFGSHCKTPRLRLRQRASRRFAYVGKD
jgi:hypothetical protein